MSWFISWFTSGEKNEEVEEAIKKESDDTRPKLNESIAQHGVLDMNNELHVLERIVEEGVLKEKAEEEKKKRERMERLSQQIIRAGASLRLELFSLGTIRVILATLTFLNACAMALGVVISSISYVTASVRVDGVYVQETDPSLRQFVLFAESSMRTLACVILTFMLLTYPQRIIRSALDSASWYRWEQGFIIVYIFIMSCTPVFSIYGIVRCWEGVTELLNLVENFQIIATATSFTRTASVSFTFSVFATAFWTTFSHLYMHGMVHFQGHPREIREKEERKAGVTATRSDSSSSSLQPLQDSKGKMRGDGEETAEVKIQEWWLTKVRGTVMEQRSKLHAKLAKIKVRFTFKYLGGLDCFFIVSLGLYFGITCGLGIYLNFHPSYVPIVSLATVIRICTYSTGNLTSKTNETLYSTDGDVFYLTYDSTLEDSLPMCSYNQQDNSPFKIAVTLSALVMLDIYFFVMLYRKARISKRNLWNLPYATTRSNQLGYAFFRVLTWITFCCVFALATVIVIVQPMTPYLIDSSTVVEGIPQNNSNNNGSEIFYVTLGVQPFNQAGIGPGITGFGCIYFMWVLWMFFLAYGYLPANSIPGSLGWFCPMSSEIEHMRYAKEPRHQYIPKSPTATSAGEGTPGTPAWLTALKRIHSSAEPPEGNSIGGGGARHQESQMLLLAFETDISTLKAIEQEEREKERKAKRLPFLKQIQQRRLVGQKSLMNLLSVDSLKYPSTTVGDELLEAQIAANVLVLETEILLYHFMSVSYDLCVKIPDLSGGGEKRMRTMEEMQEMVEDPRYKLDLYADDLETDTHAFVFSSVDRIVVSFRGSVSLKNYQTDWDSAEVEFEHGKHVTPLLEDEVNFVYARKIASRPAYVHGGFVKTYATVQDRIRTKVKELLEEPGMRRCLFITGHSLGGGLAIVCAFDLGFVLAIPPTRIAATTWGCPKVGTFSFVRRYARVVPCTHRIATANDIITKLPIESPMNDWTLRGWHHAGQEVLLTSNGNMILRPSAIERFMIHKMTSSVSAHFRMSYAVALAAWVVRTNPDMHADWWMDMINQFHFHADFSTLPPTIRELLLWDLRRPGAAYFLGHVLVRDMAVDTSTVVEEHDQVVIKDEKDVFIERLQAAKVDEDEFRRAILEFVKTYLAAAQEQETTMLPITGAVSFGDAVESFYDVEAEEENNGIDVVDSVVFESEQRSDESDLTKNEEEPDGGASDDDDAFKSAMELV